MNFDELANADVGDTGARHAALLLQAMLPADRQWLLENLPHQEREVLQALLSELESLGIPAVPHILAEAISSPPKDTGALSVESSGMLASLYPSPPTGRDLKDVSDEVFLMELGSGNAGLLASVLRAEPALLVARLLQLRDWPWHSALIDQLSHGQRKKIQDLLQTTDSPQAGAALSNALMRHVRRVYEDATFAAPVSTLGAPIPRVVPSRKAAYHLSQWWWQFRRRLA